MHKRIIVFAIAVLLFSCSEPLVSKEAVLDEPEIFQRDTFDLFDVSRNRKIPIALYHVSSGSPKNYDKLVVFSHGYGFNSPASYLAYSYITDTISKLGYLVASVQQELSGDDTIAFDGDIQKLRMPMWERGMANLQYVINELKQRGIVVSEPEITLMGHSNGGDISMFMASRDSTYIDRVVSLDHMRVPIPIRQNLDVLSIRAADTSADPGVLPNDTPANVEIVQLKITQHAKMSDSASLEQRSEILQPLIRFLERK